MGDAREVAVAAAPPVADAPGKPPVEVELATLGWVHWHNTERLHGYLGDLPPVEFEALHASKDELKAPDPGEPQIAASVPTAADRLPAPRPQARSGQNTANTSTPAVRPPIPPGSVTIMCGNPGSGIDRSKRHARIKAPTRKQPPA